MGTILIVDDKADNLHLLQVLLKANGFEVQSAPDGKAALSLARQAAPDLIIADTLMPGMDGFALCREWRRDPALRRVPFVFYTATHAGPSDERLALDLGADLFLVKPQEPGLLVDRIRAVLGTRAAEPSVVPEVPPESETVVPREGNQALVRQMEARTQQLEQANRDLERGLAERRRAEAESRAISERREAILAAIPDIITEVDCSRVYTWANRAGVEFFGEDVVGKEAAFYFEGEQPTYRSVQPLFDGDGGVIYLESWQRRRDGARRLLAWWCRALKDAHGRVTGALSTARDITERRRTEDERVRDHEVQAAMNALQSLSMGDGTTTEFLGRALDLVLSLRWLAIESRAAVFLADEARRTLQLQVHKGFSPDLLATCSTIPFGRCLCGRAAESRAVQFAGHLDERHETHHGGMLPHGHYCVPILSGERLLGVLNLYVSEGHLRDPSEEEFLKAVANTLAGAIERRMAEEQVRSQLAELRRWHEVTLGRETRVLELKGEVNELLAKAGQPPRYASAEEVGSDQ